MCIQMRTDPTPMRATDARRTSARRTHGAAAARTTQLAVSMIQRHGPLRSVAHARPRYARRSRLGSRAAAGACVCRVARCVRPALRQCVGAPPQHTPHNHTRSKQRAPFSCCLSGRPLPPPLRHGGTRTAHPQRLLHAGTGHGPRDPRALHTYRYDRMAMDFNSKSAPALSPHHTCPT